MTVSHNAIAWLRPVLPAGALVLTALLLLLSAGSAHAVPNTLLISPSGVVAAPDGAVTVSLIAEPPATTLTIWAIDVDFDPTVVTTSPTQCDQMDTPPDAVLIGDCRPDDAGDTVKVLGGLVFNENSEDEAPGDGLSRRTALVDITFDIVGGPGDCTDLRLKVILHSDRDAEETNPNVIDGKICVEADAPPSGTPFPHTPPPRTSEPTPEGQDPPDINDTGGAVEPTDRGSPDGGATGSPGDPGTSGGASSPTDGTGNGIAFDDEEDDDGGGSPVIWLLLGAGVLVVVSGGAWALVRGRSAAQAPEDAPD